VTERVNRAQETGFEGSHQRRADPDPPAHPSGEQAARPPQTAGPPGAPGPGGSGIRPGAVLAYQRSAGNAAVASSIAAPPRRPRPRPVAPALQAFLQRDLATAPEPPAAPQPVAPADDPAFTKVTGQVAEAAAGQKAHPSASSSVAEAQAAAVAPPNDLAAQAGAAQVDKMAGAKPGGFDKAAFIAAVGKAIDAAAPKNAEEATDLGSSGKSGAVKAQVEGMVAQGKQGAAKDIKGATEAAPDLSSATPKQVTPMAPVDPGAPPAPVPGGEAMPAPRDAEQTNLGNGPATVNNKMAEANVTEEQLASGNEPQFTQALGAKRDLEVHSSGAPEQVRSQEAQVLGSAQAGASGDATAALAGMHGARVGALSTVGSKKGDTKSADEGKRAEIAAHIEEVFSKTKTDVGQILDGLDKEVDDAFTSGEKQARDAFDANVARDMDAWKDERYSGISGKLRWLKDKLLGAPPEVNQIFAKHRNAYVAQMSTVISNVADVVGTGLAKATQRIADGRAEVKKYIAEQPASLRQFAAEAEEKVSAQFDSLDSDVTDKQESLASDLAQRYTEARQSVDDSITKMQEENKGLAEKAEEAVVGAVETILKLKDMLLGVLSRVAGAVTRIIADPIGFLEKLVNAVKTGLGNFVSNIGTHLKKGLTDWLFGALASAGIEIPDTFDLKGVLKLVLSVLGLTWTSIRSRLVAQVGEPVMGKIEQSVDVFKTIATEGLGGLLNFVVEKLGDFKEMVMGEIESFITDKVIKAGIEWVVGLLNPAGAFIKACEAIYGIVMFFVEKGQAIMDFVNSILDSVESILAGGVGAVADLIEGTLAKTIPLIIEFLADLLGLGGLGDKIKEILGKIQKPINKVIDAVIGGALKVGKKLFGGLINKGKAAVGYVKGKVKAGKEWVSGKVEQVRTLFSVRESFEVEGEEHQLYTDGSEDRLVVASGSPTSLDNHPDEAVRAAYAEYVQAIAKAATPAAKKVASRVPLAKILKALRRWFAKAGRSSGDRSKDPQASAPGIGNIAPMRNQPSRLYKANIPVWQLEAEHVIPRAMVNATFEGLRQGGVAMGSPDYKAQTTILIYAGASDVKTHGAGADNAQSAELKRKIAGYVKTAMAELRKTKPSDQPRVVKEVIFPDVLGMLQDYAEDAVQRTFAAVRAENAVNGKRRAKPGNPEPPVPEDSRLAAAANAQMSDVQAQLTGRLKIDG